MNKVILMGNLGSDPELKETGDYRVCKVSLATTWKKGNESQTDWHNVVFWNQTAEIINQYCKKGTKLLVEGRIKTRSYDQNGQKKYITEIVANNFEFCESKSGTYNTNQKPVAKSNPFDDDDVPF